MKHDHNSPAEYLTIDQFRAIWGVSRSTVYR
jgi:predicted DNA-binding transcriptional regulator AlpA